MVWSRHLIVQVKRWASERSVIAVGNSSYAFIDLFRSLQGQISLMSRLRLDAAISLNRNRFRLMANGDKAP
ncbi:hypothetical protein [Spirosoma luteum]|uniref:hypothetical protein n=1 Tax=Spirosoma luteum TaxID=431553 RepID=UPI00035E3D87|nr:hypothetical protein [Spirosoma luteum]